MQANVMYTLPSFRVHTETLDHHIGAFRDCSGVKPYACELCWSVPWSLLVKTLMRVSFVVAIEQRMYAG